MHVLLFCCEKGSLTLIGQRDITWPGNPVCPFFFSWTSDIKKVMHHNLAEIKVYIFKCPKLRELQFAVLKTETGIKSSQLRSWNR